MAAIVSTCKEPSRDPLLLSWTARYLREFQVQRGSSGAIDPPIDVLADGTKTFGSEVKESQPQGHPALHPQRSRGRTPGQPGSRAR